MDTGAYRVALRAQLEVTVTLELKWTELLIYVNYMYEYI